MNDSLSNIEKKINQRIQELKYKMKKANQRIETDRLWIRIEALQWVLAQACIKRVKVPCFVNNNGCMLQVWNLICACTSSKLDISHKVMYVERKRYGFGYLLSL
jgi:hypothetical protein